MFNAPTPLPFAVLLVGLVFILIAAFLVWYALRNNDEVHAKFGRSKMTFELDTKQRSDVPNLLSGKWEVPVNLLNEGQ